MTYLCHRPQPRTVIPGLKSDDQPEQHNLWLVIRSMDELPITRSGTVRMAEAHLFVDDYCISKREALALARRLHNRDCKNKSCGWRDATEPEPEKVQTHTRYYSMVRGPMP